MTADIRRLTDRFSASPQITPQDVPAIAAAGFGHIVNNRPDGEVPGQPTGAEIAAAAAAVGLGYTEIPVDHSGFSLEQVAALRAVLAAADRPVLGFCRSGTRSTLLWALAEAAAGAEPESLLETAAAAGYDARPVLPLMLRLRRA
ncbi:TIGR01244 family sulfur transferase [Thermaurantiacus tibetensis]|uniref:TIGR01244 family sulfur transferase n=1 Tax=Thermaurantiacus tibetensis TaxID=2759035 RepID=UPI00188F2D48|nr:TIGR01244 family sulfur transferase [Thermaurantiacus tibetensis]